MEVLIVWIGSVGFILNMAVSIIERKNRAWAFATGLLCLGCSIWVYNYSALRQDKEFLEHQIEEHMKTQRIDKNA